MVSSLDPQTSMKFVQGFYPTIVNRPRDLSVLSKQITTEVALTCFSSHWRTPRLSLGLTCRSQPADDGVGALVGGTKAGEKLFPVLEAQGLGPRASFSPEVIYLDWLHRCQCVSGGDTQDSVFTVFLPSSPPEGSRAPGWVPW